MQVFRTNILFKAVNFLRNFSVLEIYTDGSSKVGVGSWAYVITRRGKFIREKSGRIRRMNSNNMEFQAAIEALSSIPINSKVKLFSDSRILINAMNSAKGPLAHQEQIGILKDLNSKNVIVWHWVKAHNGNQWNERCDQLCTWARNNEIAPQRESTAAIFPVSDAQNQATIGK